MYCYAAFLLWLQSSELRSATPPEDAVGFSGWSGVVNGGVRWRQLEAARDEGQRGALHGGLATG